MPNTNYVAQGLDGDQIEAALTAIDGVISPTNNGKVLAVENGKIVAKSASEWTDAPVLEPVTITQNGTTTPPTGVDGFNSVTVDVPSAGSIEPITITENGTYTPPSGIDGYAPVTVNVTGGSEVPTDYTQLNYIESTGNQYIDTGVIDTVGLFCVANACFTEHTDWGTIAGSQPNEVGGGSTRNGIIMIYSTTDYFGYWYGSSYGSTKIPITYEEMNTFFVDTRGILAFHKLKPSSGSSVVAWSNSNNAAKTGAKLFLFAMSVDNVASYYAKARISRFTIYDHSGTKVRDYFAAKRNSDNELGLWDAVSNSFFTNQGSGSFISE